jgi:hypothetical protein
MPSAQDCAERLREQAYGTLLPQIRDLEQELLGLSSTLSSEVSQLGRKLEALRNTELPTPEIVLNEFLGDMVRQKDLEKSTLASFARAVRQKETQEEILGLLLDSAQKFASQVALLAVRGDRFSGWSSRGYSETSAQKVGTCSVSRSECPALQEAFEWEGPTTLPAFPDDAPLQFLQEKSGGSWHVIPLRAMQRPVAVLIANSTAGETGNLEALSVLSDLAALRLENIALKILYEFTATKPEPAPEPAREEKVATAAAAFPEPQRERELVESEPIQAAPLQEETADSPVEEFAAAAQPVLEIAPEAPPAAQPRPELPKAHAQEARQIAEEEKLHTDAKRFARLLVSEIKLYNEHHVLEGRTNHDLYLRLKRDIDRSREMYEKRVSPAVSRKIDYFHDEIIRILGDNNPSTLGSDYPGPRVES